MRFLLPILLALLLTFELPPAQGDTPSIGAAIQMTLDAMAAAFNSGDKAGFLSGFDSDATSLASSAGAFFDNRGVVPIEGLSFRLLLIRYGEVTRKRDKDRFGNSTLVIPVNMKYQLKGFAGGPWVEHLIYTFQKSGQRWFVTSGDAIDDLGVYSEKQPWENGPVASKMSAHFLIMSHPQDAKWAGEILPIAESALPGVSRVWTKNWDDHVPILVVSSTSELQDMLGKSIDLSNFVAFTVSSDPEDEGFGTTGEHVIINRNTFSKYSLIAQRAILSHELVHFATRRFAGPFIPVWLDEGLAQLAESTGAPNTALFRRSIVGKNFDGELPEDLRFTTGGSQGVLTAYSEALSAANFIKETFGLDLLDSLYEELGSRRADPGTPDYHLDSAMKKTLGVSLDEFRSRWAASVK